MMRRRQQGFTLIELMVALTIGLFLVSGILYIYLSTRASYASNDAAARVQEDARFAMERLTREIRMAGHTGCANTLDIQPNVVAGCVSAFPLGGGIQVFANGSGWTNPTTITRVAGTDVITLRGVRQQCSTRVAAGCESGGRSHSDRVKSLRLGGEYEAGDQRLYRFRYLCCDWRNRHSDNSGKHHPGQ